MISQNTLADLKGPKGKYNLYHESFFLALRIEQSWNVTPNSGVDSISTCYSAN